MPQPSDRIGDYLLTAGIARVEDIYAVNEIAALNHAMNPVFEKLRSSPRAYVKPDRMLELGILEKILSPRMRGVIFSTMPDPVLHHLHVYEIAANQTDPHIFSDVLSGWHRDPDAAYVASDATHVSIFVYLSNVRADDGPFEFALHRPDTALKSQSRVVSMTGAIGTSFVWHRRFFHRAAPNRGPQRRRVLKVSVQRNAFESLRLQKPEFQKLLKAVPPGNKWIDLLLGRYQGSGAPTIAAPPGLGGAPIARTEPIGLPDEALQRQFDEETATEATTKAHD
jgi:hypothetical protein